MEEMTILEMQAKMGAGQLSARELCAGYLERIEAIDRGGPGLNAVIELNPDALEIAEALDRERAAGQVRGPLHGIPILLKDNIDTHDRMQTTAGSLALEGSYARRDAGLVRRLRAAGALLLGKTNLSEWANFRGKRSISGWSSRGGLTRNPHALDRSACGSSSGSGAAAAANLCAAAVGTETDGSIICPAQTNGVVGIKPTRGLISGAGIIPIAHSQDTAGPLARTVADAALLLSALCGAYGPQSDRPKRAQDFLPYLGEKNLKGLRLGVPRVLCGSDPRILQILESGLAALKELGAQIIDPVKIIPAARLGKSEIEVLLYEFKHDLNAYLARLGPAARVHSLAEVIRFNEDNRGQVMPFFGQELMLAAQEKGPLSEKKYLEALERDRRLSRQEGIDAALEKHRLDALVMPSGGPAWSIDLVNGDASTCDVESTSLPAVSGYPHITVPAGSIAGLPLGLSFIGPAWHEARLIQIAWAFEQLTQARRVPCFLPHAETETTAALFHKDGG